MSDFSDLLSNMKERRGGGVNKIAENNKKIKKDRFKTRDLFLCYDAPSQSGGYTGSDLQKHIADCFVIRT